VSRIVCAALGVAVCVLALCALFTPHHVTPTQSIAASTPEPQPPRAPVARVEPTPSDDISEDADVLIDLYGNDVSPAVATYSFDALGSLYEEHSPQTELPRLGSPKT